MAMVLSPLKANLGKYHHKTTTNLANVADNAVAVRQVNHRCGSCFLIISQLVATWLLSEIH